MNERSAMVETIRKNPEDHTARLVYADWLDDYGEGDRDKATSEFIRISCDGFKATNIMPRKAYAWLRENFRRLIPDTLALNVPSWKGHFTGKDFTNNPKFEFFGRYMSTRLALRSQTYGTDATGKYREIVRHYVCSINLSFWKGFVIEIEYWSGLVASQVVPVLVAEQPLVWHPRLSLKYRYHPPKAK